MHKITVSIIVSLNKNTVFIDFKEGFVNRIGEKLKKKDLQGNNFFGVGPVLGA